MEVPKVFDWVAERRKCSLGTIFTHLTEVVDSDVKSAQAKLEDGENITMNRPADGKIVVVKSFGPRGSSQGESVVFEVAANCIAVKKGGPNGKELFTAKPFLLQNGMCKLEVKGEPEPLELWQVSRKALEDLFFPR
jgi:hypothetical protein